MSKNTRINAGLAPYLLQVRSMLRFGRVTSLNIWFEIRSFVEAASTKYDLKVNYGLGLPKK